MLLYSQEKKEIQFVSTKGHFWLFEALLPAALGSYTFYERGMTIVL